MSRLQYCFYYSKEGFPRVSGDEPDRRRRYQRALTFSPRERG